MKPGQLLDVFFAYVFSDSGYTDSLSSTHMTINGMSPSTIKNLTYYIKDTELLKRSLISKSLELSALLI